MRQLGDDKKGRMLMKEMITTRVRPSRLDYWQRLNLSPLSVAKKIDSSERVCRLGSHVAWARRANTGGWTTRHCFLPIEQQIMKKLNNMMYEKKCMFEYYILMK